MLVEMEFALLGFTIMILWMSRNFHHAYIVQQRVLFELDATVFKNQDQAVEVDSIVLRGTCLALFRTGIASSW